MDSETQTLSDAIIGEVFLALGFSKTGLAFRIFNGLFRKPANHLSHIMVTADRMIAADGFPKASGWILTNFCDGLTAHGAKTIPSSGPLLVISNHAGTYDTFALTSQIGRRDLKIIVSDVPFLKQLHNASDHIFYVTDQTSDRMTAARAGIRHLKNRGALLLYGTSLIDPDPAVYPDADKWIEKWLPSIDLFLRLVPETHVVISIVSGVVSPRWAHHPITWLKHIDWQKRRLAEFAQVIHQLLRPGRLMLSPRITFSLPVSVEELSREGSPDSLLPVVIARGKTILAEHCEDFYGHALFAVK